MKPVIIIAIFSLFTLKASAHGGEEHGESKAAVSTGAKYFSSEALSDKYEVLVKYGELKANQNSTFLLFLSEAATNRALDSANVSVQLFGKSGTRFTVQRKDTGIYQVSGAFPANEIYDLQVNISGRLGPDFLQVPKIEIGKKLTVETTEEHSHWYSNPYLWAAVGLLAGLLLMYFLMKNRNRKTIAVILITGLLVPSSAINPSNAHGGEDHGSGTKTGGGLSSSFIVEKESQFLFNILTVKTGGGSFNQTTELMGTVTASPQGLAVIQTPQTGKITSLKVRPGQVVNKGQSLATIEQQVDAGTQIDIISRRNELNSEVKAAKAQYDRLMSIADIAAKKDITEAKARYESAQQNLRLFNANVGKNTGSTKMISLTAPISGVIGTFNYAIGAVINAGETLFEITNINSVYIETQVFSSSLSEENRNSRFVAFSQFDTIPYTLKMVSTAQSVNAENQSQRVVFEILNPGGKFRIGENVRVLQYLPRRITQLVVPTAAIVDISGKPAVFIKDKAEQYSLSFIQKGESNAIYTAIAQGAESGERIVTENVYQMKMIYLGQ